jgi:N-acetylglucosaminyldiphosphoundecaprenol N-acetyl-beta-D-mannosaminyltransferase
VEPPVLLEGDDPVTTDEIDRRTVVEVRVDATSYADATTRVLGWARRGESRYVCVCNVHMVMEAHDDPSFREVVNGADLVTPDGVPLVWALRLMGVRAATRVYGPDLMLALCAGAAREAVPVGLYGGTEEVQSRLQKRLGEEFPELEVVYAHAPPFGSAMDEERHAAAMSRAGFRILFVALGCPRQERWMARNQGSIPAVMVGVGAAFDFLAGAKPQAPGVLQRAGLEWAFRLATEPRRLWRRYAVHNPRFVALLARQLIRG